MKLLTQALDDHAERSGESLALRFLVTGDCDGPVVELTYGAFHSKVLAVARELQTRVEVGDRVLLLYDGGIDFIVAMYGCLYAGVIAVPTYPPDPGRLHRTLPRLQAIAEDAGATVVLTTGAILSVAEPLCQQVEALSRLSWIATPDVKTSPTDFSPVALEPDDTAYLQYTSGSTGVPKGVMVSHGNLAAICGDMLDRWPYHAESHQISWLPTFHDLGLIWGLMTPLYGGVPVTFMLPVAFLQRPVRWFQAISHYRGTTTAAPNFGYELCNRKVTQEAIEALDLTCLEAAMNAAEPIRDETLDLLNTRFAGTGLRPEAMSPWYGLAESTLQVSVSGPQDGEPRRLRLSAEQLEQGRAVSTEADDAVVIIGCGSVASMNEVVIVEPVSHRRLGDRSVGEIWVSGPIVGQGYWGRREATEQTFRRRLEGEEDSRDWLDTGDLGFMDAGELYVTGRSKDLIIIRGRNIYPQDLEHLAEKIDPAVRPGCAAAFPIRVADEERIGLVCEIDPRKLDGDLDELLKRLRSGIAEGFDVQLHEVACIGPRAIYKTSSGKIQRRRTRDALLAGELEVLGRWTGRLRSELPRSVPRTERDGLTELTATEVLEGFIWDLLRARPLLELDEQPLVEVAFRELGLSSVTAVEVSGQLADILERPLAPTLLFEYPTTAALAAYLSGGGEVGDVAAFEEALRARRLRDALQKAIAASGLTAEDLPDEAAFLAFLEGRESKTLAKLNLRGPYEDFKRLVPRWLSFFEKSFEVDQVLIYMWRLRGPGFTVFYHQQERLITERFGAGEEAIEQLLEAAPEGRAIAFTELPALLGLDGQFLSGLVYGFKSEGRLSGAVQLLSGREGGFDRSDEELLKRICRHVVAPALIAGQQMAVSDAKKGAEEELADLAAGIVQGFSFDHFVSDTLQTGIRLFGAERAALYLHDDESDELYLVAGQSDASSAPISQTHLPAHAGILGVAFKTGERLWIADAYADPRFEPEQDRETGFHTKNIFCAPLVSPEGPVGVIQFLNRSAAQVGGWEHELLDRFIRQILVALHSLPLITDTHVPFLRSLQELEPGAGEAAAPSTAAGEAVAIVGLGCRFPGGIVDADSFWRVVSDGLDVTDEIPTSRWHADDYYDPDPDADGKSVTRRGGFIDGIEDFDASFFGISPREARQIDPQHRLVLECAWEAIEHAGIVPRSLMGSDTGVFVGLIYQEYAQRHGVGPWVDGYTLTGNTASVASGRISYFLGLEGPSLTIDTACSSSLVTLHLACQALGRGDCRLALAGGATLMLTPTSFVGFSRMGGLAPDGRCKTFSARADGTSWAEGCGMLVLKRLTDAQADGDRILGVIRGSAVNQDGRSNGLTAPNGPSQRGVIQRALSQAGVLPSDIDYVECHGTGTSLGDPIEVMALDAVLSEERERPLLLGSVKTNLGHTQAAAGVAGVIKTLLAMEHDELPPSLHCEELSPHIPWAKLHVDVVREQTPWARSSRPRRAGVSSFGISGTNVHLVLEEAPVARPMEDRVPGLADYPLPISARTLPALRAQAQRWSRALDGVDPTVLDDSARMAATRRTHFDIRAFIEPGVSGGLVSGLEALGRGDSHPGLTVSEGPARQSMAWLFTGQGSQVAGMGQELYDLFPVFRECLDEVSLHLDSHLSRPLLSVMFAQPGSKASALLGETVYTQCALFAFEVSLARLWQSWGAEPDFLMGHSIGEISAACVAGVFSLEDASALVGARGRLMQGCRDDGGMLSIQAPEHEVLGLLDGGSLALDVAGVNAPERTVVSGDLAAIDAAMAHFQHLGRKVKPLDVSHAFHSTHMDAMLEAFGQVAQGCRYHEAQIPIVSNVTGQLATEEELMSPGYWVRHVREAVRFYDGIRTLDSLGVDTFLECGPRGVLCALGAMCLDDREPLLVPSIRKERSERGSIMRALGQLYVGGIDFDWDAIVGSARGNPVELPTYAFQRDRHWVDTNDAQGGPSGSTNHDVGGPFWDAIRGESKNEVFNLLGLSNELRAGLEPVLPHLSAWHRERESEVTLDSWTYRERWDFDRGGLARVKSEGHWLVVTVADAAQQAEQLAETLVSAGVEVTVIEACIAPKELSDKLRPHRQSVSCVVSLTAWAGRDDHPDKSVPFGFDLTLSLLQAFPDSGVEAPLFLLTQGAVKTGAEDVLDSPKQALVWGLGRVFGLEHAERFGGLLDLPEQLSPDVWRRACAWMDRRGDEDQVALRSRGIFVRRLVRSTVVGSGQCWRGEGTVLITGGTGALGAHVARWMAGQGAQHLVLTSRRGLEAPGASALMEELEELGVRVTVASCDVADRAQLRALVDSLKNDIHPLNTVVHTAGVVSYGWICQLELEEVHREMQAKVAGAWNLHHVMGDYPLKAMILYGSIAGLWGSGQQGAYSASNAALEAVAHKRRELGHHALVVHWGPWAGGGMVRQVEHQAESSEQRLRKRGLLPMAPERALRALGMALRGDETSIAVVQADWARLAPILAFARPRPFFAGVDAARAAMKETQTTDASPDDAAESLRAELESLPESTRLHRLRRLVSEATATVLGAVDGASIDTKTGFTELGFDSLMAVELRKRLESRVGLAIPATLAFDHPTVDAASRWLATQLVPEASGSTTGGSVDHGASDQGRGVAIVGVGLRLPGGVDDLESLWDTLIRQVDTLRPIPPERYDMASLYDPDPDARGRSYVKHASLLDDVASFDASFFGISPREAAPMDPQHRLLLEAGWTALEDAGIPPDTLKGTTTGVFIGMGPNEYGQHRGRTPGDVDAYDVTGSQMSFAAGRLAYHLGLQGPALSVDTACSSSLVAMQLATEAIRAGKCEVALAAGVQVLANPQAMVLLSQTRAVAPDGRSKTFSSSADGYGRGEGVGVVVMMSLDEAQRQGREVLAVLKGAAVNHDGTSSGITAPNGTSQQRVLEAALRDASLEPRDVDVIECHGTGTTLGDPIEVQALAAVYGTLGTRERPLELGTVKTNMGHLESAAGVAGVLKILAAFRHQALPATLHTSPRNPHIPWASLPVRVTDQETPWPREVEGRVRRAGVSGFGLSGTNAHVILEEPPLVPDGPTHELRLGAELPLFLSARGTQSLQRQAHVWLRWLGENQDQDWFHTRATAAVHRSHLTDRACVFARDPAEAEERLTALAAGRDHPDVITGGDFGEGRIAFLFTGQGSQTLNMGYSMLELSLVFRAAFEEVAAELNRYLPKPIEQVMFAARGAESAEELSQTRFTQPALFAFEVAWARLWIDCQVHPDVLLGHSVGELVAAHVAGVLSLEDAAKLVCARGDLMQRCEPGGAMASLRMDEDAVVSLLASQTGRVCIAGVNGPRQTVISGDATAVETVMARVQETGHDATRLRVSHAFHSAHMDSMLEPFREVAESCSFHPPKISVVSNITGQMARAEELTSPDYWVRHVREAVRFRDGMATLVEEEITTLIECGPRGVLSSMGALCVDQPGVTFVACHRRDTDEGATFARALGQVYAAGHRVAWSTLLPQESWRPVKIPTYSFERQRHWLEVGTSSSGWVATGGLPLLGAGGPVPGTQMEVYRQELTQEHPRWLADHVVAGDVVVPATALMAMMLASARARGDTGQLTLREVQLLTPLRLEQHQTCRVQVLAEPDGGAHRLRVYSDEGSDGAILHAQGLIAPSEAAGAEALVQLPPKAAEPIDVSDLYDRLARRGLHYGPSFRGLREAWRSHDGLWVRVALGERERDEARQYDLHPALLDSAFHAVALELMDGEGDSTLFLPFALGTLTLVPGGRQSLWACVKLGELRDDVIEADLSFYETNGALAATVTAFQLKRADPQLLERLGEARSQRMRFQLRWEPVHDAPRSVEGRWGVVSHGAGESWCAQVGAALRAGGAEVVTMAEGAVEYDLDGLVELWGAEESPVAGAYDVLERALNRLQGYDLGAQTRRIWMTSDAVAVDQDERASGLATSGLWGLARSARHEEAELKLQLIDIGAAEDAQEGLEAALGARDEPELAVRGAQVWAPRLARADEGLAIPAEGAWRVVVAETGRLDKLRAESVEFGALGPDQARVEVHAAGLNFRDVLNALGMVPIPWLGLEVSGIVTELGSEVTHLKVGQRVFGLGEATFASSALADARYLTPIPAELSFEEAATIPLVYLTAWYALRDLANLSSGQAVLIHAAAGGVGMAAVQLAHHIGAEVFATASQPKWGVLRGLGIADSHIGSSRDLGFERAFRAVRGDRPIDAVLNALARDFVDASLRLLGAGGSFLEMGKTDIRSSEWLREHAPGVSYHTFDLLDVTPERIQSMLVEITALLHGGALKTLPHQCFPIARLPHAFRFMAQAKHIGKLVVLPRAHRRMISDGGTVLVTGAFGPLGKVTTQWLVERQGVRHLLLASRRGLATPGAEAWVASLETRGVEVTVAACDVAVQDSVQALMGLVSDAAPLCGVVHTAGVLEDGMVMSQDADRLRRVLGPKVRGAWNLHWATREHSLDVFILYSSLAGLLGNVGQSNYAAANVFMDALAQARYADGLPALSMLWGPWADGGMAAALSGADQRRMARQGITPLSNERGMDLLERAVMADSPISVAVDLDLQALEDHLIREGRDVPALFAQLMERGEHSEDPTESLSERLARVPAQAREATLGDWVAQEVARVLGLQGAGMVNATQPLKDMGVDSLMAVELRNRLMKQGGVSLPATLVFDYPHVQAITAHLWEHLGLSEEEPVRDGMPDEAVRALLGRLPIDELRASGMLDQLMAMAEGNTIPAEQVESTEEGDVEFDALDDDELLRQAMQMIED